MNFRNVILDAVRDCLYKLEIHSTHPIGDRPGFFYPVRSTGAPAEFARSANMGYHTPTWETYMRPIRPQDVGKDHMIPCVFVRIAGGTRSASGTSLQDSPRVGLINHVSEDYQVDVQGIFRDGYGLADASGKALPLSYQINNFIYDLDDLLNVETLRGAVNSDHNLAIPDAYIVNWESQPAAPGSTDEIVVASLKVQVNYRRGGDHTRD